MSSAQGRSRASLMVGAGSHWEGQDPEVVLSESEDTVWLQLLLTFPECPPLSPMRLSLSPAWSALSFVAPTFRAGSSLSSFVEPSGTWPPCSQHLLPVPLHGPA